MSSKRYSSPVEVRKIKKEPLSDSEDNISTERSHRHSSSRTSHRHEKESRHGENRRRRHSSGESDGDRRERRYERPKEKDRESHHRHVKREPSEERRSLPRHRTERNEAHIKREKSNEGETFHQRRNDRRKRNPAEDDSQFDWGRPEPKIERPNEPEQPKEKPTLELSGKLAVDTNTYKGVVIKYNQPAEARQPRIRWRLYPFKGSEALPVLYVHRQSAYLIGRERRIVDVPVDHPSCSKQHAVLQYRLVPHTKPDGSEVKRIKPYIIDLASANGTYVNGQRIEAQRYVELFERDVLKFGFSSREYVLLNENSQDVSSPAAGSDAEAGSE